MSDKKKEKPAEDPDASTQSGGTNPPKCPPTDPNC